MQQRFRKLALFVGATSSIATGGLLFACSTDNGTSTPTTFDSSTPTKDGSKPDGGPDDPDTSVTDGGMGADCSEAPKLRTNTTAGGFFCAFYKADGGDAGGLSSASNCSATQTCCNPGRNDAGTFPPAFCADGKGEDKCLAQDTANNSEYTAQFFSNAWECNDKTACPNAGDICVMFTSAFATGTSPVVNVGKSTDKDIPAACNALQAFKQGGTKCKAGPNAAADEIKLCSVNDPTCGSGTTCTPFSGNFRDLGYCR